MVNNMNEKFINVCPVCKSKEIEQLTRAIDDINGNTFRFGSGSYCKNCGVKFQFNTSRVNEVLTKEKKYIEDYFKNTKFKDGN